MGSSEMPHKLPLFEGFQLGKVANAYARLEMRDDLLFDDIADEVLRRPQELNAVDLLLIANAFGHFRNRHPRLWLVLADWIIHSYLDYAAADVVNILNAASSVGFHHEALIGTLLRALSQEPLISEVQPGSLALALHAVARLRWSADVAALSSLADGAIQCMEDMEPAGVTQLLNACAQHVHLASHSGLVEGCLMRAHSLVSEFNAQSLSILVHACAKLRQRDVTLLTKVAKAMTPRVKEFKPQALAMIVHGFANLEVRSEILFYMLAAEIVDKIPLFSGQGISMVLHAFGRLQINNERL